MIAAMVTTPSPFAYSGDLSDASDQLRTFDYEEATDFAGIEDFVSNEVRGLINEHMTSNLSGWLNEFHSGWLDDNMMSSATLSNTAYREAMETSLREKLTQEYPAQLEGYLRDRLLTDVSGELAGQVEQMISNVTQTAISDVGGIVDHGMDYAISTVMGSTENFTFMSAPDISDYLSGDMARSMVHSAGESTREGLKQFMDEQMRDAFGLDQVAQVASFVEGKLGQAADTIDDIKSQFGDLSFESLEGKIQEVLDASGLSNPYGLQAADYLLNPQGALAEYAGMVDLGNISGLSDFGVNLPSIEIPGASYGVIQISSAVRHYLQAIKVLGVDPNEIRMGNNCLKTANWVLEDKNRAFTIMGGRLSFNNVMPDINGMISEELLGRLGDLVEQMELMDLANDVLARTGINDVIGQLDDLKRQLDEQVLALQDMYENAMGTVDDALQTAEDAVADFAGEQVDELVAAAEETFGDEIDAAQEFANGVNQTLENPYADAMSAFDPVVLYKGEFKVTHTDLKIKSRGMDFEFTRIYRNQWESDTALGYNWTHNYAQRLILNKLKDGGVLLRDADGQIYRPGQLFVKLTKTDDGYEVTSGAGVVRQFGEDGKLKKIVDRFGNTMRFQYSGPHKSLTRIIDTERRKD
jgi:hypothetical protein